MKFNRAFAAMAAAAFSVSAYASMAMTAEAAQVSIAYKDTDNELDSLGVGNDGISVRKNIYNVYGNNVVCITPETAVKDQVTVNFTVSGIGSTAANTKEDGSADPYVAYLAGEINGEKKHERADIPADDLVSINGDGSYTATFHFRGSAEKIDCLYLQTNINFYQYAQSLEDSGVRIKIDSITTEGEESGDTQTSTTTTSTAASSSSSSTTAASSSTASTAAADKSASTGDAGVGVAAAALAFAAATAFVVRKKD
ncbi:MAG: hypothetical protein IKQ90_05290 [Ruminococcus sp.]|nr:hypothetical protein [Ruminococcus sp.]